MGTSKDATAGKGGDWTPLKRAATDYAKTLSTSGPSRGLGERVLSRAVTVLGGGTSAVGSSRSGSAAARRLGGFLSATASQGLEATLRSFGLEQFVGKDRFELLDALMTLLAGDGADDESQAARDAVCDVIEQMFGAADDWEELSAVALAPEDVRELLEEFLGAYVYNRMPVIAERLARAIDPDISVRGDQNLRAIIREIVVAALPDDPLSIDWAGPEGAEFVEAAMTDIFQTLEAFE